MVKNLGVVDCNIIGNFFVGGVAGINHFIIKNCYSTGNVSGNVNVGGMVGENYGTIKDCTTLNTDVIGTGFVARVVENSNSNFGEIYNNYAWSGMGVMLGGSDKPLDKGLDKVDGEDVFAIDGKLIKSNGLAFSWKTDLGFREDIWNIPTGTYKLPKLHGSNASYPDMPGGMAQEVIISQGKTEFIYAQGGVDITTAFNVLPAGVDVEYTTSTEGVSLNGSMLLLTAGQTGNTIVSLTATVDASSYNSSATLTTNITVSKTVVVVVLHQNQTLTNQSWVMW